MAVIVAETDTNLSAVNGFYRAEAYNFTSGITNWSSSATYALGSRTDLTFSNAGNLRGIIIGLIRGTTLTVDYVEFLHLLENIGTATMTIASPCVVTKTSHGFTGAVSGVTHALGAPGVFTYTAHGITEGMPVGFTSTGTVPTGLTASTLYYAKNVTANTFEVSPSPGTGSLTTTSNGTGTISFWKEYVEFTTTGALPTGLAINTRYCVKYIDANTFNLSATSGGANINTSGSQSGTHTCWTGRAMSYMTPSNVSSGSTDLQGQYFKGYFVPMKFSIPYPVTTGVGNWRMVIGASSGDAATAWAVCSHTTSGGNGVMFVAWCDTAVTFSSGNDMIVCGQGDLGRVTIDMSATLKAYQYYSTTYGICGLICRGTDPRAEYCSGLVWENPPSSSYTLTLDGCLMGMTYSGFQVGSVANPIPYAQKAVITCNYTPSVGAIRNSGFFLSPGVRTQYYDCGQTVLMIGEVPAKKYATLTADCLPSTGSCTVDDGSVFTAGDTFIMTKQDQDPGSTRNLTLFTVTSVVGNTVNFSGTSTVTRLTGGLLLKREGYGIEMASSDTTNFCGNFGPGGTGYYNFYLKGVRLTGFTFYCSLGGIYSQDLAANNFSGGYGAEDCFIEKPTTLPNPTANGFYVMFAQHGQDLIQRRNIYYAVRQGYSDNRASLLSTGFSSGLNYYFEDNIVVCSYYTTPYYIAPTFTSYIRNNILHNNNQGIGIVGARSVTSGNYSYGAIGGFELFASVYAEAYNNTLERGSIYVRNNQSESGWGNPLFFKLYNNTWLGIWDGYLGQYVVLVPDTLTDGIVEEPNVDMTDPSKYVTTQIQLTFEGTKLAITNNSSTANKDFFVAKYGFCTRCGTGLVDTTVYGANSFSWKLRPTSSTNAHEISYKQIIGDQAGYSMFVYMWVKINNAAYWAGTHRLPRLYVDYDNGTEAYSQAAESTDWQQLIVPITPTTSYAELTISLNGYTDATTTNADFYLGQIGVVLPAGRNVDPGSLAYWANAEPLKGLPTSLSAFDVWSVPTSQLTGAGTVGDLMTNLSADTMNEIVETEGSYTLKQALSILLSICAGKTSGGGLTFKTPNGDATRALATVDAANNRTSMTLTPSS